MADLAVYEYPEQATEITVLDRFGVDQQDTVDLSWTTKKVDLPTIVASMQVLFPDLFKNIYNSDGELTEDREVDLGTYKLMFMNGNFYVGTNGITGGAFKMELVSTLGGLLIASQTVGLNISANNGSGLVVSGSNIGIQSNAPKNIIKTSIVTPGTTDPSSLLDLFSSTQGVRVFPKMSISERDAIVSPAPDIMIQNRSTGYPDMNHVTYGWQPIGYGEIRLIIDFSVTPLNSGNSYTIELLTNIPEGKIIHKMVGMGISVLDPAGDAYFAGIESDPEFFAMDGSALNSDSGVVSSGNSKRTTAPNENLVISYAGATGTIDSGVIELLILHT